MPRGRPPKPVELTEAEARAFAAAYIEIGSAAGAMRKINPKLTARSSQTLGSLMLKRPDVVDAIRALRRQFVGMTIMTATEACEHLSAIGRGQGSGIMPPSAAEQIAAIKQLGVYLGWGPEDKEEKTVSDPMAAMLARIRLAPETRANIVQDAVVVGTQDNDA